MNNQETLNEIKHIEKMLELSRAEVFSLLLIQELRELNRVLINSNISR